MLGRHRRTDEDFHEEIRAHIALEADRLVEEEGLRPADALAAAHRAFGNVTHSRERFYESTRWIWLDHLVRDLRTSLRWMVRLPASTAAILLSLAVGIGASTSIYSLADQTLVRSLPVVEPGRLVQLHWAGRFVGGAYGFGSLQPHPLFRELRAEQDQFLDVFARYREDAILTVRDQAEPVSVEVVSGSYFPTLGIRPAVGRLFTESDDLRVDGHPLVVLAHDFWEERFGSDPNVVGRTIRINDYPMTVIGVAEAGFHGTDWSLGADLWVPLMMTGEVRIGSRLDDRRERFLHVYARLLPGVSAAEAEARLQPWFQRYLVADMQREGWPSVTEQQREQYLASRLELRPGRQGQAAMDADVRAPMIILAAATTFCLLLACLNVANLTLARTLARRQTIALRSALGASRTRIVIGQLVESGLLAVIGTVAGALLAPTISRGVLTFLPASDGATAALEAGLDLRVLALASALAILATIISAAAPAWHAARVRPVGALKQESGRIVGGHGSRRALVVVQFALALILLVGAGLFTRTLGTLRDRGPGFTTSNLLMFTLAPERIGYDPDASRRVLGSVLETIEASPDVARAGVARWETLRSGSWNNFVTVQGPERRVTEGSIPMNAVSADFFAAFGVPIVSGRAFDERDRNDDSRFAPHTAIVNEEFVTRYLDGRNPLGVRVGLGDGPDVTTDIEIVGVVPTFAMRELRAPEPQIYFSMWERSAGEGTFYVRASSSSASASRAIQDAVARVDPRLAVLSLRTIDDQLDRMLLAERMLATAAGAFAAVATLLALIGLYGLLAFTAVLRRKEIGVRMALGARRWSAGGLILREAAWLAAVGTAIALPVTWGLGRLVENQLFGVQPMDRGTTLVAAAVLALVCLVASAIPARKAASVNPVEALRAD